MTLWSSAQPYALFNNWTPCYLSGRSKLELHLHFKSGENTMATGCANSPARLGELRWFTALSAVVICRKVRRGIQSRMAIEQNELTFRMKTINDNNRKVHPAARVVDELGITQNNDAPGITCAPPYKFFSGLPKFLMYSLPSAAAAMELR